MAYSTAATVTGGDLGAMTYLRDGTVLVQNRNNAEVIRFYPSTGVVETFATYPAAYDGSGGPLTKPATYPGAIVHKVWTTARVGTRPAVQNDADMASHPSVWEITAGAMLERQAGGPNSLDFSYTDEWQTIGYDDTHDPLTEPPDPGEVTRHIIRTFQREALGSTGGPYLIRQFTEERHTLYQDRPTEPVYPASYMQFGGTGPNARSDAAGHEAAADVRSTPVSGFAPIAPPRMSWVPRDVNALPGSAWLLVLNDGGLAFLDYKAPASQVGGGSLRVGAFYHLGGEPAETTALAPIQYTGLRPRVFFTMGDTHIYEALTDTSEQPPAPSTNTNGLVLAGIVNGTGNPQIVWLRLTPRSNANNDIPYPVVSETIPVGTLTGLAGTITGVVFVTAAGDLPSWWELGFITIVWTDTLDDILDFFNF